MSTTGTVDVVVGATVDDVVLDVVVDAVVVVVVPAVVVGASVVVGVSVVVVDVGAAVLGCCPVSSSNSSNWFSARSWAREYSMPVPHSW